MRFQMLSDNGSMFNPATITLSTVQLPSLSGLVQYESCVFFSDGNSEVVQKYANQVDAAIGHKRISAELGLK